MNDKETMEDTSRKMKLNPGNFSPTTPLYPSTINEICEWFNGLGDFHQQCVKWIVQDAIQQHEDNKEKKDAQAHIT